MHTPCASTSPAIKRRPLLTWRSPPPAQVIEVSLTKGAIENAIGLTLQGDSGPPRVKALAPESLAELSGRLRPDQVVLEINGTKINGHEHATKLIKESTGVVNIILSEEPLCA